MYPTFYSTQKMPRKSKQSVEQSNQAPLVEEPADVGHEPTILTKADYLKAKATIKQFREEKKNKPKRPCTEKQLAALAAGRARNKHFANKTSESTD